MIKQFSAGDITVRPFKTFKNWVVQSLDSASVDRYGSSTYYNSIAEINEGKKITSIFFPSGSAFYTSSAEPMNPSGKYARNIYSLTNTMFYKNAGNPIQLFGVERWGTDRITGKKEIREINDRIITLALNQSVWGEKVRPNTVKILDNSNRHTTFRIYDDGYTNLYISGSQFSDYSKIGGVLNLAPRPYFDTASIQYFVTQNDGTTDYISFEVAKEYASTGLNVSYVSHSVSWSFDESAARNYFQPENEHFGESVSCWYKYVAVGASMDEYSLSTARQGYAAIFKYDSNVGGHRLIKKFYCPFSQNSLAQEFGADTSFLLSLENNNFLMLEQSDFSSSYLEDSFGYSVAVRDNFLVIGSPTGSLYASGSLEFLSGSHPGFVYVYQKDKGGIDNWGILNALVGSSNGDLFGNSVAIDSDVMVVGAPGVSGSEGAAYVYRRKRFMVTGSAETGSAENSASIYDSIQDDACDGVPRISGSSYLVVGNYTWTRETVLSSSVLQSGDKFGWSVAIDSGSIVIGTNKTGYGYASVFTASYSGICPTASWGEVSRLYADNSLGDLDAGSPLYANDVSNTISSNGFGKTVAISNNTALIGCAYDKAFVPYQPYPGDKTVLGAAYFYQNISLCGTASFYKVLKTFGDRSIDTNNNFGRAVSIENNFAAITSWPDRLSRLVDYATGSFILEDYSYDSTSSQDPRGVLGRVVLYNYDDVNEVWKLTGELKQNKEEYKPANLYGYSVSVCSDFLAVGAPVVNEATASATSSIFDHNTQISSSFPSNVSGSVFIYPMSNYQVDPYIGNVFYKNGYFVLTTTGSSFRNIFTGTGPSGFNLEYQGTHTIYEHEYLVSIRPGEFNYSTNPSSLVNNPLAFDVNQDGVFDIYDIDLIMRYLQKKKFLDDFVFDDDGLVLEQDTLQDYSWWNNDILMIESEDVLVREPLFTDGGVPLYANPFTRAAFEYIENNLVSTGILDIDGNGKINTNDGYILSLYYLQTLNPTSVAPLLDASSARKYVKDIKEYLNQYCLQSLPVVNPEFLSYQYSSSYDSTGSYLSPVITTIGLYENNQLVAVGKMGRPLKNLIDWPLNIVVRFDT